MRAKEQVGMWSKLDKRRWSGTACRLFFASLATLLLFACGSDDARDLNLLKADGNVGESEEERLRRMQLIRVIKADGTLQEVDWRAMDVDGFCLAKLYPGKTTCSQVGSPVSCRQHECLVDVNRCAARVYLAMASPQQEPVELPVGRIPEQSAATSAGLARSAAISAAHAAGYASDILDSITGRTTGGCYTSADARKAATSLVDMVELYREATDRAVELNLAVADAQRSSTPSLELATKRAVTGTALSRVAAARLLVAGVSTATLPSPFSNGFCTRPDLGPDARAALSILRQAAPNPASLTFAGDIDVLLNSYSFTAVPLLADTNIRQRLSELQGDANYFQGKTVQDFFGLSSEAFEEARTYLRQEVSAFGRPMFATVKPRPLPGGGVSARSLYVATATEPPPLPEAFYGALVRHAREDYDLIGGIWHEYTLDIFLDQMRWRASRILALQTTITDAATRSSAMAPLALLMSDKTIQGRMELTKQADGNYKVSAHGFSAADKLLLVSGEDQLRCALTGTNEGASCTLTASITLNVDDAAVANTGFSKSVYGTGALNDGRIYLVKPKNPSAPAAGSYVVLTSDWLDSQQSGYTHQLAPIAPDLDARVADILRPSKSWCTQSALTCAGTNFDERLPLEDELTNDGDGVESSWKHYLTLARQAADEADVLGAEYLNAGLADTQRDEELDIRREEALQRADAEIANLQSICGTAVDPRRLLKLLGDDEQMGGATESAACPGTPCTGSRECIAGSCVVNLAKLAEANRSDPEIRKIADCLSDAAVTKYVSLGDKPLCLWRESNENLICTNPTNIATTMVCPYTKGDAACTSPATATLIPESTRSLGWFDMDGSPQRQTMGLCKAVRALRKAPGPSAWTTLGNEIVNDGFFHPANVGPVADGLNWRGTYGGFSEVTYNGAIQFTTGSAFGAASTDWPCGAAPSTIDCANGTGLFCQSAPNCTEANRTARAEQNYILLKAVLAAKLIARTNTDVDKDKIYIFAPFDHSKYIAGYGMFGDITGRTTRRPGGGTTGSAIEEQQREKNDSLTYDVRLTSTDPFRLTWTTPAQYSPTGATKDWAATFTPFVKQRVKFSLNVGKQQPRSYFLDGLSNFQAQNEGVVGQGWFVKHFTGEGAANITIPITFPREDTTEGYDPSTGVTTPPASYLGTVQLQNGDLLNGLELLCQVAEKQVDPLSFGIPQVRSLADIAVLGDSIRTLAKTIEAQAGAAFFRDVPTVVTNALEKTGPGGQFDQYSGHMLESLRQLQKGFLAVRESVPLIASEIDQMGYDLRIVHDRMTQLDVRKKIQDFQMWSTITAQMAACAGSWFSGSQGLNVGAGMSACSNAVAQTYFAAAINGLQKQDLELEGDIVINETAARLTQRTTNLQTLSVRVEEGLADVSAALARLNNLRNQARLSAARAVYLASWQSQNQTWVTNVVGNLYAGKQLRYQRALKNAKLMAFLAKRAIEQRLGVRLAELTDAMPLVDAPSTWEASVCTFTGLDYSKLKTDGSAAPQSFADGFIGDYVTKLENVVESYRLQHNFHEGTDTAVVSLRDDIMNIRAKCEQPIGNLLYRSGDLDSTSTPGWTLEGCRMVASTAAETDGWIPEPNCITARPLPKGAASVTNHALAQARGFSLAFDEVCVTGSPCGWQAGAALVQSMQLDPGVYRLSWYTKEGQEGTGTSAALKGGAAANVVLGPAGDVTVDPTETLDGKIRNVIAGKDPATDWNRVWRTFRVSKRTTVRVGFAKPAAAATGGLVTIAAPMLEQLPNLGWQWELPSYAATSDSLTHPLPVCEDTGGDLFRASRWRRDCMKLCADGFGSTCSGARSKTYCYRETTFGLTQRDIQMGKVFNFSGFARGNFNYRIESVALNFVGSGTRSCEDQFMGQTCYSAGFYPYTLEHIGPFYVRNHAGADVRAYLFDGAIEHARGLASERYLTNPLSSTDQGLVDQYVRSELQGRPLDGNFVLRVWEEPGVDFEALEDVQLVLKYRYWTRFD